MTAVRGIFIEQDAEPGGNSNALAGITPFSRYGKTPPCSATILPIIELNRRPPLVELWAQCEAKSPTMAADLLTQSRRRSHRPPRYAALLAIIAVLMLVTYLIR